MVLGEGRGRGWEIEKANIKRKRKRTQQQRAFHLPPIPEKKGGIGVLIILREKTKKGICSLNGQKLLPRVPGAFVPGFL